MIYNFLIAFFTTVLGLNCSSVAPYCTLNYGMANITRRTIGNGFDTLGGFPNAKIIDCKDGYVYYNLDISKTKYTNKSNLYLVHTLTQFTPGYVTKLNNVPNYDQSRSLGRGYVHLALEQYKDSEKNALGSKISPKEYWPRSSTYTTSITSTFGATVSINSSIEQGVEIGNGGSLGASATENKGSSLSFTFSKALSSVTDDPRLSTQTSPTNVNEAQWSFEVINKDVAGKTTYYLDTYFLFEMDNYSYQNANCDSFILTYSLLFVSSYKTLWWWNDGYDYTNSIRIGCFL